MTLVHPWDPKPLKKRVFCAVAGALGMPRRALTFVPMRRAGFAQSDAVADTAFRRAKVVPKSKLGQQAKHAMLRGQYNWARAYFTRNPDCVAAVWNGMTGSRFAFAQGAKDAGARVMYCEIAPFAGRITLDPKGVNFEGSVPQDPAAFAAVPIQDLTPLRDTLTPRKLRRAEVSAKAPGLDQNFVFCPLQVPNDSQVRAFAGGYQSIEGFVAALAKAAQHLPDGWHLRLREHPSAKTSVRNVLAPHLSDKIRLDNATDAFAQMRACQAVVTLNSSMGLQAMLFDKPVLVAGRAFYGIDGLVALCPTPSGLNHAFANVASAGFDADLRQRFLSWLITSYYPAFPDGASPEDDRATLARHFKSSAVFQDFDL